MQFFIWKKKRFIFQLLQFSICIHFNWIIGDFWLKHSALSSYIGFFISSWLQQYQTETCMLNTFSIVTPRTLTWHVFYILVSVNGLIYLPAAHEIFMEKSPKMWWAMKHRHMLTHIWTVSRDTNTSARVFLLFSLTSHYYQQDTSR